MTYPIVCNIVALAKPRDKPVITSCYDQENLLTQTVHHHITLQVLLLFNKMIQPIALTLHS